MVVGLLSLWRNAGLSSDGEATEPSAFISRASKSLRRSPGKDPQGSRKKRGRKTGRKEILRARGQDVDPTAFPALTDATTRRGC